MTRRTRRSPGSWTTARSCSRRRTSGCRKRSLPRERRRRERSARSTSNRTAAALGGQGDEDAALVRRRRRPEAREVVVLAVEHLLERGVYVGDLGLLSSRDEVPKEVRELLGRVRMTAGQGEQPLERRVGDSS